MTSVTDRGLTGFYNFFLNHVKSKRGQKSPGCKGTFGKVKSQVQLSLCAKQVSLPLLCHSFLCSEKNGIFSLQKVNGSHKILQNLQLCFVLQAKQKALNFLT